MWGWWVALALFSLTGIGICWFRTKWLKSHDSNALTDWYSTLWSTVASVILGVSAALMMLWLEGQYQEDQERGRLLATIEVELSLARDRLTDSGLKLKPEDSGAYVAPLDPTALTAAARAGVLNDDEARALTRLSIKMKLYEREQDLYFLMLASNNTVSAGKVERLLEEQRMFVINYIDTVKQLLHLEL